MLNKSFYHTRSGSVLSDPELLQRMSRESVKSWHKPAAELPVPQMIVDCVIRDFHRTPVVEQEMMAVDLLVLGRVLKELTYESSIRGCYIFSEINAQVMKFLEMLLPA